MCYSSVITQSRLTMLASEATALWRYRSFIIIIIKEENSRAAYVHSSPTIRSQSYNLATTCSQASWWP